MAFILHYLRPDELFIDVGANVGSYTVLASGAAGARTLAFEPVPTTAKRLRANCEANGITSKVVIRQICLGERDDVVAFSTDSDTMNTVVADLGTRARITVPLRRLDSENVKSPRAVKIDAEGYDNNVLAGAVAQLSTAHPQALLIETLGGGAFGCNSAETENRLGNWGFKRCRYEPFSRELIQDEQRAPPQPPVCPRYRLRKRARRLCTSVPHSGFRRLLEDAMARRPRRSI